MSNRGDGRQTPRLARREGLGAGGGAVVPILEDDLSFGMSPDLSKMWLSFKPGPDADPSLPKSFLPR